MERKMRRFRQQLPDCESERILREGRYAVMAVAGDDEYPYAVPVNYVLSGRSVYLHSASQGHKIDSLLRHPKCSMCVVDKDDVIPEEFTSYFRSVIVFGQAHIVESGGIEAALREIQPRDRPGRGDRQIPEDRLCGQNRHRAYDRQRGHRADQAARWRSQPVSQQR